jgi:hypothetical protein
MTNKYIHILSIIVYRPGAALLRRAQRFGWTEAANLPATAAERARRMMVHTGSASLCVLFDLIGSVAGNTHEHANEIGLSSGAGRACSGRRAGRRSLGDLGDWAGNRLMPRMPGAIDAPAQPICPTSSRSARARRRRDREDSGEPQAMSERRL